MPISTIRGPAIRTEIARLLGCAVLCSACQTPSGAKSTNPSATITIDVSKPLAFKIPPTVFGTFLEPIGNSIFGGLWADSLTNPSSELSLPLPWEPLDLSQGARYEPLWDDPANSFRSILVMAVQGGETGVRQKVYLPVHRVLRYNASFSLNNASGARFLEISIRSRNRSDVVFASQALALKDDGWQKYAVTLIHSVTRA